ncbi:hypothetical protein F0L68_40420 [Solihabitans fulvus]|uniref:Uncharacterized protein n=1 Tax=Solihabitans fulvus TaxID=1892852 RepID=A0A5B2W7F4_9PSEU|nr:hypothetical protein [Solihabitans fulvus]KAA2247185.1 hypothetical protein F0L68_40420 [Solihabitans fulvus]
MTTVVLCALAPIVVYGAGDAPPPVSESVAMLGYDGRLFTRPPVHYEATGRAAGHQPYVHECDGAAGDRPVWPRSGRPGAR